MSTGQLPNMEFDLTVVIPTIGRESLVNAVDSIVEPELSVQVIVVTDKIQDLSLVFEMLSGREVVIVRGPDLGAPGARNEGIRLASSKYISFLDDDDLWMPTKATKQIREIEMSGDSQNAFSVVGIMFHSRTGQVRASSSEIFHPKKTTLANFIVARKKLLYGGSPFCTPSILMSASFRDTIKFKESTSIHDDWDFMIRLAGLSNTRVVQLQEKLVRVNQGSPNSISAGRDWSKSLDFLDRHSLEITGRSRFDFILCHILLPAINSRSKLGVIQSLKRLPIALPHLGGAVRFCAGVILRR